MDSGVDLVTTVLIILLRFCEGRRSKKSPLYLTETHSDLCSLFLSPQTTFLRSLNSVQPLLNRWLEADTPSKQGTKVSLALPELTGS